MIVFIFLPTTSNRDTLTSVIGMDKLSMDMVVDAENGLGYMDIKKFSFLISLMLV